MIQLAQYNNNELQAHTAMMANYQAVVSATFVAVLVLTGFVVAYGIIAAMQGRPRAGNS